MKVAFESQLYFNAIFLSMRRGDGAVKRSEEEEEAKEQVGTLGRKWCRRESERGGKNWIQSGAGETGWTNK